MKAPSMKSIDLDSASARLEHLRADEVHFEKLAHILKDLAGINLAKTPKNMSLMAARLARLFEKHGIDSYGTFLQQLQGGRGPLVEEFISAMTTNTTEFFRESRHFEQLSHMLPGYLKERRNGDTPEIRVWCAASSSGQEVYSLLITLLESEPSLTEWNLKMLATDIDLNMLDRASLGMYTESEVTGIPPLYRQKYFTQQKVGQSTKFVVTPQLRNFVTFAPFNLMTESYPFRHPFDIVFCRNVLIYFDRETATTVTERIAQVIRPAGFLVVGHSEVGLVKSSTFASEASAFYRKIRS
ncbi:MAG TPA: CheR family methyltransferase [Oligoflexus sp.]|uniref:CheR family methyltransferase n=1 Tax=Oligoflexus sp. TaxID=1971216 RepID=UPI002D2FB99E|nr:CheR family methyltransferase [Oligoflexus sp.]HYX38846.1 CheR family methyltransferase [Oligoflexus sp.]